MTREHRADIVILGAGPAGYTAAIYAARASRRPILLIPPPCTMPQ